MTVSVRYIVDDVGDALTFYVEQLEFTVKMNPAPGFAMLQRNELLLLLNAPGEGGAGRAGGQPEPGGWNRFQVEVDDLDSLVLSLRAANVTFRGDVVVGNGGRQVLIEDPAGNPIELFQAR